MSVWRSFYSFHVRFFYFMSCFIDRVSLKCPTLWPPKTGYHNTPLSSASVPHSYYENVGVAEMETPKLWGNVLDLHNMLVGSPFWRYLIFISFKPLRSIHIKYLYSIIFNIRALICLIWCLYNDVIAFCDLMHCFGALVYGERFVHPFVFPYIFDSKRLLYNFLHFIKFRQNKAHALI